MRYWSQSVLERVSKLRINTIMVFHLPKHDNIDLVAKTVYENRVLHLKLKSPFQHTEKSKTEKQY